MRNVKKLACLLSVLAMLLALSVNIFAAGAGSITINNAVTGQNYTIYRILELESYDAANKAYAYKASSAWKNFVESAAIKDIYLKIDDQGYVTWVGETNAERAEDFAKLAQIYAAENNIQNQGSAVAASATVEFENLELGYYLVDSAMGTLCALDTTNPSVDMKEKNKEPVSVKEVQEDSTGNYSSVNDADIGQAVNFRSTITAQAGAQNYIFHDKMSEGLTFGSITSIALNGTAADASYYTVKTSELGDDCTFHVVFTQDFCNILKARDSIVISYTASVNDRAVIGGAGNPNESRIEYGERGKTTMTPPSTTRTHIWKFDVFKYTTKDGRKAALKGAEFILYKEAADGTRSYAAVADHKITGWVTEEARATVLETPDSGEFTISGLDSDTYYLKETLAPAGYNTLKDPIKIVIGENGVINATEENSAGAARIEVENQNGAELPSTGGVGTTVFYVTGSVLVLAAVVLLVTHKRMDAKN